MTGNRVWRLNSYPNDDDFASAMTLRSESAPSLANGEVAIAVDYVSLDAGTRMWMTPRTDGYQPPIPLGSAMPGQVMGLVIESRAGGFRAGDRVRGFGQWADVAVVRPETSGLTKLEEDGVDPLLHLGPLGMNGWTALVGIEEVARTRMGDIVAVSAAAGATGMLAAQIAKLLGARVIGIAGGERKCAFLVDELGLDAAIDHRSGDIERRIAAAAPQGIDVYFENVGGPLLDAVLPNMALHGRVAVCGLVAGYAQALPGPSRFDQVLARRLQITGFFSPDFAARGPELTARLRQWVDRGALAMPFDVTDGLENMLLAYARLFAGANIGKVVVRVR